MAEPLSIAGSIAGLVSLADTVFKLVYRYGKTAKHAEKEIADLKRELVALTGIIHNVHLIARELEQDALHKSAIRLDHVNTCLNLLHQMKKKLSDVEVGSGSKIKTCYRKLAWPYKSPETRELIGEIRSCRDALAIALSADSMYTLLKSLSLQENIEDEISAVRRLLQENKELGTRIRLTEKRKKILSFFLSVDPTRNFETNNALRHPTTGFWLTGDAIFQQWLNGTGSCLWLSGIPGAGKSVLSTLVIEECIRGSDENRAVAYFYCDYKNSESQDPMSLLGTLASQIGRQNQEAFEILEEYYQKLHPENKMATKPKSQDLLMVLKKIASAFDDVRLVVDALDECGESTRAVAKFLQELASCETQNVSLVLLSRNETDIRDLFAPPFSQHIEVAAHTEDVEQYVRIEIENRTREKKLRIRNPDLRDEIVRHLVEKADGMFRWVACQLDYLSGLITDRQIRKALVELPTGLDETYRRLLGRIHPSAAPLVRRVLYWTIHNSEPLSINELLDAISVEVGTTSFDLDSKVDEDTAIGACSSLIRYAHGHALEIAHFTVQEYLQNIDPNDPQIGGFKITEKDAKSALGKVCLTYLCMPDFDCPPPATLRERDERNTSYPFYNHATQNWNGYAHEFWDDEDIVCLSGRLFDPKKTYNFISFFLEYIADTVFEYDQDDRDDEWGSLVEKIASGGFGPLHGASSMHLHRLCKHLVDMGCNVNQVSSVGTPLQVVFCDPWDIHCGTDSKYLREDWEGTPETVAVLVNAGATPQLYSTKQDCSLSLLAYGSDLGMSGAFRFLLDSGMPLESDILDYVDGYALADNMEDFFNILEGAHVDHLSDETRTRLLQFAGEFGIKAPQALRSIEHSDTRNLTDERFRVSVLHAIKFDQPDDLKKLIVDERFKSDKKLLEDIGSALHYTAKNRSLQAMSILLDSEPSEEPTMKRQSGMTVWHIAARYGGIETLNLLIATFGNQAKGLTAESDTNTTPLMEAILGGDQMSALHLLEITRPSKYDLGEPALIHLCTSMGMSEMVDRLIRDGFDPKATSSDGSHALFFVSPITPVALVEALLLHGLALEATRTDGKMALHVILSFDANIVSESTNESKLVSHTVAAKLISHTVTQTTDNNGHDPWYYFCTTYLAECGYSVRTGELMARVLIEHDALPAYERITGKSAISLLIDNWNLQVNRGSETISNLVCWAINHGTDINLFLGDEQCTRALVWSLGQEHSLTDTLLEKNADVHAVSSYWAGKSALIEASSVYRSEQVFQKILRHVDTARLNDSVSETRERVIHHVCDLESTDHEPSSQNREEAIKKLKALLQLGVDPNATTDLGETALLVAASSRFPEAFEVLLDHGADPTITTTSGVGVVAAAVIAGDLPSLQKLRHLPGNFDWTGTFHLMPEHNIFPEFKNGHSGCNALHAAATLKDAIVLKYLGEISQLSSKLDDPAESGFTPLHFAVQVGSYDNVEFLLRSGANLDAQSFQYKNSPLHLAIRCTHMKIFSILVDAGASFLSDVGGHGPEELAAILGRQSMIKVIQEARQTMARRIKSPSDLLRELGNSIATGDVEATGAFVRRGALKLGQLPCGCTPLICALCSGQPKIASFLLEEGASTAGKLCAPHAQSCHLPEDVVYPSAAYITVSLPQLNAVLGDLLVKYSLNSDHWAWDPINLIHVAAEQNGDAIGIILSHLRTQWGEYAKFLPREYPHERRSVIEFFLEGKTFASLVPRYRNYPDGTTPLVVAAGLRHPDVVKLLLDYGSPPNSRNALGYTALHMAAKMDCLDSTTALLEAGGDPFALDLGMMTPLAISCLANQISVASIFAKLETTENRVDIQGRSALHHATTMEGAAVFHFLLERGLDPYLQDRYGDSPISLALQTAWGVRTVCNYGFDLTTLEKRSGIATREDYAFALWSTTSALRMLLKRLPQSLVHLLLEHPGTTSVRERYRIPGKPLALAAYTGQTQVMKILIEAGADIDGADPSYGSPLLMASAAGQLESVKLLVRRGAQIWPHFPCRLLNAVHAAHTAGHENILRWLLVERYIDQKQIPNTAEVEEHIIRPWSGIRCISVPVGDRWKRRYGQSLWEYLLYIEGCKKAGLLDPLLQQLRL